MQEYIDLALGYLEQYSFVTENKPLFALVLLIASFLVAAIAMVFIKIIMTLITKRTKSEMDDELLHHSQTPIFRLIVLSALLISVQLLELEGGVLGITTNIILSLIYLTFMFYLLKASAVFYEHGFGKIAEKTKSTIDDEILPIAKRTTSAVIWIFGIILILGIWGVDVGPFLAGLGIAGLAISFAVQDSLSNIFGGVSIIMDRVYKVGDRIQLDSGETGEVIDVGLRSTRVRTFDNEVLIIPNGALAKAKVKNYVQPDTSLRVVVKFGVEYGTKPDKVKKILEPELKKIKGISKSPAPIIEFTDMGESSLNCIAKFWVPDYTLAYDKKLEATDIIYNELNKAKIGIPFPTRTVYMKK